MTFDEVVAQFESEHRGKFSEEDRHRITSAVSDLQVSDFSIKYRRNVKTKDGNPYSTYFHDSRDIIHVHPRMVVARHEFAGCNETARSKYAGFPFIVQLSNWTGSSGGDSERPICPECFIEIPLVGQCGICGFDLDALEEDE